MATAIEFCKRSLSDVETLISSIQIKHWDEHSALSFARNLENVVSSLDSLNYNLKFLAREFQGTEIHENKKELETLLHSLRDCMRMERSAIYSSKNLIEKGDDFDNSSSYEELRQKIADFLLRAMFELQRAKVKLR